MSVRRRWTGVPGLVERVERVYVVEFSDIGLGKITSPRNDLYFGADDNGLGHISWV